MIILSDTELFQFLKEVSDGIISPSVAFAVLQKEVAILKGQSDVSKRKLKDYEDSQNDKNYYNNR